MKIRVKIRWLLLVCSAVMIAHQNFGQSLKRQVIASYGSVTLTNSLLVGQTAGQSFNTTSRLENSIAILQGFQQPVTFAVKKVNSLSTDELDVKVYPNPATYTIAIESAEEIERANIRVLDMTGRIVFSEKVPNLQLFNINCGSWANGHYIIIIDDNGQRRKTFKLIISK